MLGKASRVGMITTVWPLRGGRGQKYKKTVLSYLYLLKQILTWKDDPVQH
jgi:hypothetical protein